MPQGSAAVCAVRYDNVSYANCLTDVIQAGRVWGYTLLRRTQTSRWPEPSELSDDQLLFKVLRSIRFEPPPSFTRTVNTFISVCMQPPTHP